MFDGEEGRTEDLNNFHFGVVGKAYGLFPEKLMLKKAGEVEMQKYHKWIKLGFQYYKRNSLKLDQEL